MKYNLLAMLFIFLLLLMNCTTSKNTRTENNGKLSFPIKILSGEVDLNIIVYSYEDKTISWFNPLSVSEEVRTRINQHNEEAKKHNAFKEILNTSETKKAGDYYYYEIQYNQKVVVIMNSKSDTSTVECTNKVYSLRKNNTDVYLSFFR
jgi:hypothetical protein